MSVYDSVGCIKSDVVCLCHWSGLLQRLAASACQVSSVYMYSSGAAGILVCMVDNSISYDQICLERNHHHPLNSSSLELLHCPGAS